MYFSSFPADIVLENFLLKIEKAWPRAVINMYIRNISKLGNLGDNGEIYQNFIKLYF